MLARKLVIESISSSPIPPDEQQDAEPRPDVGEILYSARRRRRISIKRAAAATYIPAGHLRRLESGDLGFQSAVYVRSFLREYATYLKLDPESLSDVLDELEREEGNEAEILAESERHFASRRPIGRRVAGGLAVVAAFLWAVSLIPATTNGDRAELPSRSRGVPAGEEAVTGPAESSGAGVDRADPGTTGATAEGVTVEITASTASCWMEVKADGRVIFSDTLEVGESRSFEADKRMTVRLGLPGGIELTVNGIEIGSPGGLDPITVALPRDLKSLAGLHGGS